MRIRNNQLAFGGAGANNAVNAVICIVACPAKAEAKIASKTEARDAVETAANFDGPKNSSRANAAISSRTKI